MDKHWPTDWRLSPCMNRAPRCMKIGYGMIYGSDLGLSKNLILRPMVMDLPCPDILAEDLWERTRSHGQRCHAAHTSDLFLATGYGTSPTTERKGSWVARSCKICERAFDVDAPSCVLMLSDAGSIVWYARASTGGCENARTLSRQRGRLTWRLDCKA